MKTTKLLEKIAENLQIIDSDRKDRTITKKEFETILESPDAKTIFKSLCANETIEDWNRFKNEFVPFQKENGLTWIARPGQGGPISLDTVELPATIGQELAKKLRDDRVKDGSFEQCLQNYLRNLYSYLDNDVALIDFAESREAFKNFTRNGKSYKFTPGRSSVKFVLSQEIYTYQASKRSHTEFEFGELILSPLKKALSLDLLLHSQSRRSEGKYRNIDFVGFKIQRQLNKDEFLMYSFELKPSNSIHSISQAISQAVNYHYLSNYTYIVIPFFDTNTFYDLERLQDLLEMCKKNNLGVLSVSLDHTTNQLMDIVEVLQAPKTEIENFSKLLELVHDSEWEICPLCKRIVNKEHRKRCGWLIKIDDDEECMKALIEKKLILKDKGVES